MDRAAIGDVILRYSRALDRRDWDEVASCFAPGAYAEVGLAEVIGPSAVTGGIVASTTTDGNFLEVGYLGAKRFLRVTLVPTGLTNGGPVSAWVAKGSPRHAPQ